MVLSHERETWIHGHTVTYTTASLLDSTSIYRGSFLAWGCLAVVE